MESIPCSECGLYYSHRQRCSYWTRSTVVSAMYLREAEQIFAPRIYRLEKEIEELKEQLKVMSQQKGVACLKHDLIHYLKCGHCLEEAIEVIKFYANESNFSTDCGNIEEKDIIANGYWKNHGDKAAQFLKDRDL